MRSKEPREIVHESLSLANAELIEEASSTTRMSDVDTSRQEAAETVSDAPIDVDDLPSDAEASTSAGPAKPAGPGRPKGKSTTTTASNNGKDAEQGLDSFLLPRSTGKISSCVEHAVCHLLIASNLQ